MGDETDRVDLMLQYLDLLQRWNRTYNLTAIREPEHMLTQHIFDSLAVVPWLRTAGLPQHAQVSDMRSEEHTSELQSLMRISYAVFCLKKKKHNSTNTNTYHK